MKSVSLITAFALATMLVGCATQKKVSTLEDDGDRRIYHATYDQVWRAAVDAAQDGDLEVTQADRTTGYIGARRSVQSPTFGENVGLWLRTVDPARTEVAVISRQAGPPVAWVKNWQDEIHRSISANLTRESVGTAPREVVIERGTETYVVPRGSSSTIIEQQRRINALRAEREARERDLRRESDPARRGALDRQLDGLNSDIRLEEQRLRELR
ncbi:MAG TPA: hypothetical protein VK530_20075 [Candidatus Acidoferrum sp.]|nr:hypothetical protein [Candidatus Acidoferrum sp.]